MIPIDQLSDDEFAARMRQAIALSDAPAAQIQAAVALWPRPAGRIGSARRRFAAELIFDSAARHLQPAFALRSTGIAERQMLFSTEGRDIDLRALWSTSHLVLAGQILGPDQFGRVDVIRTEGDPSIVASGKLNTMGEFRIEDMAPGRYQLVLTLGADEIVLPAMDLSTNA